MEPAPVVGTFDIRFNLDGKLQHKSQAAFFVAAGAGREEAIVVWLVDGDAFSSETFHGGR